MGNLSFKKLKAHRVQFNNYTGQQNYINIRMLVNHLNREER